MVEPSSPSDVWRKSSFSQQGNCLEWRSHGDVVDLRNSRDRQGPVLRFTVEEWRAFTAGVRNDEFEVPTG